MSAERNDPLIEAREIVISLLADEKLSAGGRQKLARVAHCLGVAKSPWQSVALWMHDPIVKTLYVLSFLAVLATLISFAARFLKISQ